MKPTDVELATRKVLNILDKSGLEKEGQRNVILDLTDEEGNFRGPLEGTETFRLLREGVEEAEAKRDLILKNAQHDAAVQLELVALNDRIDRGKSLLRQGLTGAEKEVVNNPLLKFAGLANASSPGFLFAKAIEPALQEFIRTQRMRIVRKLPEARRLMKEFMREQAVVHEATPAQLRYVEALYDLDFHVSPSNEHEEMETCVAWATAVEYIPNIRELMKEFERRIGLAVWPPNVDSAQNMEALCMALGYCWSTFRLDGDDEAARAALRAVEADQQILSKLLSAVSRASQRIALFIRKTAHIYNVPELARFSLVWVDTNFAKLEVGHKFAASLALTEIPEDIEVKAPWGAWSFVVPDGLFDDVADDWLTEETGEMPVVQFSRVFCIQDHITFIVCSNGRVLGPLDRGQMTKEGPNQTFGKMLDSLVRGACLALSDPDQYKKKRLGNSSTTKNKREGGAPDLSNARYMLTAPVSVDLRDVVKTVQRGEKHKGGKLTVQFLVRGHWKNQVHGAGRALRKRIWIQPFWKGDENARVLLRNYVVKNEEETRSSD